MNSLFRILLSTPGKYSLTISSHACITDIFKSNLSEFFVKDFSFKFLIKKN